MFLQSPSAQHIPTTHCCNALQPGLTRRAAELPVPSAFPTCTAGSVPSTQNYHSETPCCTSLRHDQPIALIAVGTCSFVVDSRARTEQNKIAEWECGNALGTRVGITEEQEGWEAGMWEERATERCRPWVALAVCCGFPIPGAKWQGFFFSP